MSRTRAQIARENGAKSKSPITAEGKAKSSKNALKHGLLSTRTIIGNEDANEFKLLPRQPHR